MRSLEQASRFGCASCRTSVTADDLEAVFAADFLALVSAHPALVAALTEDSPARQAAAELAHLDYELETITRKRDAAERMFAERVVSKAVLKNCTSRLRTLSERLSDAGKPAVFGDQTLWLTRHILRRGIKCGCAGRPPDDTG